MRVRFIFVSLDVQTSALRDIREVTIRFVLCVPHDQTCRRHMENILKARMWRQHILETNTSVSRTCSVGDSQCLCILRGVTVSPPCQFDLACESHIRSTAVQIGYPLSLLSRGEEEATGQKQANVPHCSLLNVYSARPPTRPTPGSRNRWNCSAGGGRPLGAPFGPFFRYGRCQEDGPAMRHNSGKCVAFSVFSFLTCFIINRAF